MSVQTVAQPKVESVRRNDAASICDLATSSEPALRPSDYLSMAKERLENEPALKQFVINKHQSAIGAHFLANPARSYRYVDVGNDTVVHCCRIGNALHAVKLWMGEPHETLRCAREYQRLTNLAAKEVNRAGIKNTLEGGRELTIEIAPIERVISTSKNGNLKNVFTISPFAASTATPTELPQYLDRIRDSALQDSCYDLYRKACQVCEQVGLQNISKVPFDPINASIASEGASRLRLIITDLAADVGLFFHVLKRPGNRP